MPKVAPLRLYGTRGCPSAYAIRDFLQRSDIPFEWIELRDKVIAQGEVIELWAKEGLRPPAPPNHDNQQMPGK